MWHNGSLFWDHKCWRLYAFHIYSNCLSASFHPCHLYNKKSMALFAYKGPISPWWIQGRRDLHQLDRPRSTIVQEDSSYKVVPVVCLPFIEFGKGGAAECIIYQKFSGQTMIQGHAASNSSEQLKPAIHTSLYRCLQSETLQQPCITVSFSHKLCLSIWKGLLLVMQAEFKLLIDSGKTAVIPAHAKCSQLS